MKTIDELWAVAEGIAKYVHLDKTSRGYVAQLNRRECICERCSVECTGKSPVEALEAAIKKMKGTPMHEKGYSATTIRGPWEPMPK